MPHWHPCLGWGSAAAVARPRVGVSSGALWDTLTPEQPNTYVNLAEDDINDAANHYEEIKDIPGVTEVALPGKSQRRGVNIQGLGEEEADARAQRKKCQVDHQ